MRFLIYLLTAAISLFACSKEEKASVPGTPASSEGTGTASPAAAAGQQPADGPTIKISPGNPTAVTDLQALLSGGGGRVAYRWYVNNRPVEGENNSMLFKDRFSKGDTVSATVIADGKEATASVVIANSPPKVASVPFSPKYVYTGVDITAAPVGSDADGDSVRFRYIWAVNGQELVENAPTLKGDAFRRGDRVSITVIPYDNEGEGAAYAPEPLVIPDGPPKFISTPVTEIISDTYAYRAAAADPDGDVLTYALASAPQGMTIDGKTGAITWNIRREDAGVHAVEVVAQDPEGLKAIQKYSLAVTIP